MPNVDFCAPVDLSPSYSNWMDGKAGNEVGSWARSVEGATKKTDVSVVTPQVNQSKGAELMQNIALAIARKIDSVWDRINPGHQGSAVEAINSIFHDPSISAPQINTRTPTVDVHATREQVQALFTLRSEILQLGREKGEEANKKTESKIQEYDALLESMGGRDGEFYKQVNEVGSSLMEKYAAIQRQNESNPSGAICEEGYSLDFEMQALQQMLNDDASYKFIPSKDGFEDTGNLQEMGGVEVPKAIPEKISFGSTKDRKEKSVEAAMNELSKRMKPRESGGNGLVPNFRIAVKDEQKIQEWMKQFPFDFSSASDEDLINYIKRLLADIGAFDKAVSSEDYKALNEKVGSPEEKDNIIVGVRGLLRKGADGKIAPEVRKYIEMIGSAYQHTNSDVHHENNSLSFITTIVKPFYENLMKKDQRFLLCDPLSLVKFICENYEQILIED